MGVDTVAKMASKMRILSFKDAKYSQPVGLFPFLINPENYQLDYKLNSGTEELQGQGTSKKQVKFNYVPPPTLQIEFLFDSSGIIDGLPRPDVFPEVELLKKFLIDYYGSSHDTPYVILSWGTFIFKGKCQSLNFTYKMFSADGRPTRVSCKASFLGSVVDLLRVREENAQSPDLTHYRVVKDGDTLPLMCYNIYGDSKYYMQVAKVNSLANFREIKAGMELFFPPIAKTTGE